MDDRYHSLCPSIASVQRCAVALVLLFLFVGGAAAWDADLDLTYHSGGKSWAGFMNGSGTPSATAVAVQPDGKVLMAGTRFDGTDLDFAVIRLEVDGYIDYSFGWAGTAAYDFDSGADEAWDMVIQPDGKIVVVGSASQGGDWAMGVVRFNTDGSLDDVAVVPFTNTTHGLGVALQPDGKIVVCGRTYVTNSEYDFALARLNSDLTMDTTFSLDGMTDWDFDGEDDSASKVAIRNDGKIVAAGTAYHNERNVFGLMVFSATGAPQFLGTARFLDDAYGLGLDLQSDGKAVVSGTCETNGGDFALARFNTNAILDTTFSADGMVTSSFNGNEESATDVVVQHSGMIVVTGYLYYSGSWWLAMARYNSEGSVDGTFNNGSWNTYIDFFTPYDAKGQAMFQLPDGRILAAGFTDYDSGRMLAVARFMGDEDLIFIDDFESSTLDWWSSTAP